MESKEKIEDDVLAEIAKVLKVPEEAIRNFDEEMAICNIQNNYQGGTGAFLKGIIDIKIYSIAAKRRYCYCIC